MDNGSVDGPAPAAFIDQAVAYSKSRAQINELLQLKGTLIVQDISVDLLVQKNIHVTASNYSNPTN